MNMWCFAHFDSQSAAQRGYGSIEPTRWMENGPLCPKGCLILQEWTAGHSSAGRMRP